MSWRWWCLWKMWKQTTPPARSGPPARAPEAGKVVPVVGAGSCRSPCCGVRDRHTVGVLKNQTHPRLGALRASGRCCRPGGEVCPGWRSGLGLRTSSPASVSTGGVGGDTRLRRPVPGWEPVGRGVGLLFEIWIVDASIFQTRVCPCLLWWVCGGSDCLLWHARSDCGGCVGSLW